MATKQITLEEAKGLAVRLVGSDIHETRQNISQLLEDIYAGLDDSKTVNLIKIKDGEDDEVLIKKNLVSNKFMVEAYIALGMAIEEESESTIEEVIEQYKIHQEEGHDE